MEQNLALVSLTGDVKRITADINRIQRAYDKLKNKSTKYALDHIALITAYREALAVYVRHLEEAQKVFSVNDVTCHECGGTDGGHYLTCSQVF